MADRATSTGSAAPGGDGASDGALTVALDLNGRSMTIDVRGDEAAVDTIRERCGLTGTKYVCGSGVCGACTVLVDGTPTAACLLPATALDGTRCWYVRHPALSCFKSGGDGCPARGGDHSLGVVVDLGPCVHPHPSSIGMALLASDAQGSVTGRLRMPVADLWATAPTHGTTTS